MPLNGFWTRKKQIALSNRRIIMAEIVQYASMIALVVFGVILFEEIRNAVDYIKRAFKR